MDQHLDDQQNKGPAPNNGSAPNDGQPNANQNPNAVNARNVMRRQRDMVMQRLDRWISFVTLPEFARINFFDAKMRIERGAQLFKQMEAIQLDVIEAAVPLGEDSIAAYGVEFMDMEERYWNTSSILSRRLAELAPAPEQQIAANAAGAAPLAPQINVQMAPPPNT